MDNMGVAVVGSVARGAPPHIPLGDPLQAPPANKGTISQGSSTVFVDGAGIARSSDPASCCNDPSDQDTANVIAAGGVFAD